MTVGLRARPAHTGQLPRGAAVLRTGSDAPVQVTGKEDSPLSAAAIVVVLDSWKAFGAEGLLARQAKPEVVREAVLAHGLTA